MDMTVAQFFGITLSIGAVVAGITQIVKVANDPPASLLRIPYLGRALKVLVDTIIPENPMSVRLFVGVVCFILNAIALYIQTGTFTLDLTIALMTIKSFVDATAGYTLVLKQR